MVSRRWLSWIALWAAVLLFGLIPQSEAAITLKLTKNPSNMTSFVVQRLLAANGQNEDFTRRQIDFQSEGLTMVVGRQDRRHDKRRRTFPVPSPSSDDSPTSSSPSPHETTTFAVEPVGSFNRSGTATHETTISDSQAVIERNIPPSRWWTAIRTESSASVITYTSGVDTLTTTLYETIVTTTSDAKTYTLIEFPTWLLSSASPTKPAGSLATTITYTSGQSTLTTTMYAITTAIPSGTIVSTVTEFPTWLLSTSSTPILTPSPTATTITYTSGLSTLTTILVETMVTTTLGTNVITTTEFPTWLLSLPMKPAPIPSPTATTITYTSGQSVLTTVLYETTVTSTSGTSLFTSTEFPTWLLSTATVTPPTPTVMTSEFTYISGAKTTMTILTATTSVVSLPSTTFTSTYFPTSLVLTSSSVPPIATGSTTDFTYTSDSITLTTVLTATTTVVTAPSTTFTSTYFPTSLVAAGSSTHTVTPAGVGSASAQGPSSTDLPVDYSSSGSFYTVDVLVGTSQIPIRVTVSFTVTYLDYRD